MSDSSRRDFLKLAGCTLAGLTLGELLKDPILARDPFRERFSQPPPGRESLALTVCGQCAAGCSLKVRLVDGLPKKLFGNPLCPVSRGGICPAGEAGLQSLYDPDRWLGPVTRERKTDGPRGWRRISWEKGLEELQTRIRGIMKDGKKAGRVLWIMSEDHSCCQTLVAEFLGAIGGGTIATASTQRDPAILDVSRSLMGKTGYPFYDLENASFILSFGTPLFEGWWSPVYVHRSFSNLKNGEAERRGTLVQVEPRLSQTGAAADEWIAVRPGTEAYLALGMANVITREKLYDADFVDRHSEGFADWKDPSGKMHAGFRSVILSDYQPSFCSEKTGVPVEDLLALARSFAKAKAPIAIAERGLLSHGAFLARATATLNALVGNIGKKGGLLFPSAPIFEKLPGLRRRKGHAKTKVSVKHASLSKIFREINSGKLPLPELVVFGDSSVLNVSTGIAEFEELCRNVPFVVSFSPFRDSSSGLSDLVLPKSTALESWRYHSDVGPGASLRHAVSKPVIAPILDTRQREDVLLELARVIAPGLFPWKSLEELCRRRVNSLYKSRRGGPFSREFETSWLAEMERGGWWAPAAKNEDEFWKLLLETGGWQDPLRAYDGKRTRNEGKAVAFSFGMDLRKYASGHTAALAKTKATVKFPFLLYPFEVLALVGHGDPNQSVLQEILSPPVDGAWSSWVEINPRTAASLGLRQRDLVKLVSEHADTVAQVRLSETTPLNVVCLLIGNEQLDGGRWAAKSGPPQRHLIHFQREFGRDYALALTTRVRIEKV